MHRAGTKAALLVMTLLAAGGIGIAVLAGSGRVAAQIVDTPTPPPTFAPPTDTPTPAGTPPLPTDTPTSTPTTWPRAGAPHTIQLSSDPDEVVCDGQHPALIRVRLLDASGNPVANGTPVYFMIWQGYVTPDVTTTSDGDANTFAYPNNFGGYGAVQVQVDVARIEATLRILCMPPAEGCSPAPWPESPPAISPPQTPCPTPTSTPESPCGFVSPPCDTPTPPPCSGETSPPCATPTSTPTSTRTAAATATPAPDACADVTGDHLVDWRDVYAIARHMGRRGGLRYDLNHDGKVNSADLRIAVLQRGRRC
jgi:hypothetical protein